MSDTQIDSLHQQLILEHYRTPRNRGELESHSVDIHMRNPTCGDEIRLQMQVADDVIEAVRFRGEGCSISQASASMMCSMVEGLSLDEARALSVRFVALMHGDDEAADPRSLGDLRALGGVSRFPVRIKCALLGFEALQEGMTRVRAGTD